MQSILSTFKRPLSEVGDNNTQMRMMHEEEEKKENHRSSRERWTVFEDLKLTELVAVSGPGNWSKLIGDNMPGRTAKTCRSRWFNHLDPSINKEAFSDEEDAMLLEAQRELGSKWCLIAKHFDGRTGKAVMNRWHKLMNRKSKKNATSPHDLTTKDKRKDSVSDESRKINNSNEKMLIEKMQYSCSHDHFSKPSSSSLPSSALAPSSEAVNTREANNIPLKFIDFLGVGNDLRNS